jgi:thiol:disulfide interchange protein
MDKPTEKRDRLRELASKYNLGREDFFKVHNTVIVTRTGVEKIASTAGITLSYDVINLNLADKEACVKCTATQVLPSGEIKTAESFGESTPYNTKAPYPVAMAEKRAKARAILQLTEFYSEGVYAEDESDAFERKQ